MEAKNPGKTEQTKFTNKVTITAARNSSYYVFVCKKALLNHDTIELHALGLAMSACVSAADALIKYVKPARG